MPGMPAPPPSQYRPNAKYNGFMQPHDVNDPTPGTFDNPTSTPNDGGNDPGASKPIAVPSTGNDTTGWNWEQVLVAVLGLAVPDRNDLTQQQWTAINFNSSGGTDMYRIYAVTWGENKDVFVYLNPDLLKPGYDMDTYIYQPKTAIYNAVVSANDTAFQNFVPQSFTTAADAMAGVTDFYNTTNNTFQTLSNAVAGDASAFKGQAGAAFAQIMNNLYQITDSAYTQMAVTNNYAQMITDAGTAATTFLTSLWGGIVNWWSMVDHNPLGAIYQAMLDGGVITGPVGGPYQLANPDSVNSSFGDLRTEQAWQAIEAAAKTLWTQSVVSALDPVAQSAISALASAFENTTSNAQPLAAPTLQAIAVGAANGVNPNIGGDPNLNVPGGACSNLNVPGGVGSNLNVPGGASSNLNVPGGAGSNLNVPGGASGPLSALGNPGAGNLNVPGGASAPISALGNPGAGNLNVPGGASAPISALGNPGAGNLNVPGGASAPISALGNPGAGNLNVPGGASGPISALANPGAGNLNLPGGASAPGSVLAGLGNAGGGSGTGLPGGVSSPQLASLQTALGNNRATQAALQQALSLAPATGPVHNALETALANNKKAGSALQAALGGTVPAATALQNALASNGQAQTALRQALALAPAKGPLHNALQTALKDSGKTQSSLNQSLTNGSIPGTAPINRALHSDTALSSALNKALVSAQVPSHGPLHDALTSALAQSGHVKSALDQALAGATPNTPALNHALSSNTALQSDLRKALSEAPAHGALHNELLAAVDDSKNIGTQIHQALGQAHSGRAGTRHGVRRRGEPTCRAWLAREKRTDRQPGRRWWRRRVGRPGRRWRPGRRCGPAGRRRGRRPVGARRCRGWPDRQHSWAG